MLGSGVRDLLRSRCYSALSQLSMDTVEVRRAHCRWLFMEMFAGLFGMWRGNGAFARSGNVQLSGRPTVHHHVDISRHLHSLSASENVPIANLLGLSSHLYSYW